MTDDELDKLIARVARIRSRFAQRIESPAELIELRKGEATITRLARLGLRRDREVCGACAEWMTGPEPNDGHPERRLEHPETSRGWCSFNDTPTNENDGCTFGYEVKGGG